jgi:ring-1,2-phenylacetyl-CoA epoxidase subunit PaaD
MVTGAAAADSADRSALPEAERRVWSALDSVADPEIPSVSVVEMGMVESVAFGDAAVTVTIIPTFSGCPAIGMIRDDVRTALVAAGFDAEVQVSRKPWTTDRLSDSAKEKMRRIGLAPPRPHGGAIEIEFFAPTPCPWCSGVDTVMDNQFGPTLCRAIYYCNTCRQPFEKFKPL